MPRLYGRGNSSVASFVMALNRVNVVAVTTILVLHAGVIGHHAPCRYVFMFPRRSYHARLRARGVRGGRYHEFVVVLQMCSKFVQSIMTVCQ